jgi:peptidoglycan hydrolase-like protein with peptidoglycan-binding domain
MSRKGILVLILIVIAVGVTVLWFALPKTVVFEEPNQDTTGFTPLGEGRPDGQSDNGEEVVVLPPDTGSESSISSLTVVGRLTKIANKPVAGFTTLQKTIELVAPEPETTEPEQFDITTFSNLKLGDNSEQVAVVKHILNQQENGPALPDTPDFDVATKNAVIAFQEMNNLQPDGVVGPKTKQALNVFQGFEPPIELEPEFETQNVVRYLDRETGHVFDYNRESRAVTRISSTNIPRVHHAFWSADGESVLVQLLDVFGTTVRTFKGSLEENGLSGEFLEDGLGFAAVSDMNDSFFVLREDGDYTEGLVGSFGSSSLNRVFRSPYSEWMPQWNGGNSVMLTTLASAFAAGYSFELDTNSQTIDDILVNKVGLTTRSNSKAGQVLFSINNPETEKPGLFIRSLEDGTEQSLGIATLAEKCTWHPDQTNLIFCGVATSLPNGTYPDDWYQGRMTISDNIWIINTETLQTNQLINIAQEAGMSIDMMDLQIDQSGEYLLFTDKNTLHLWEAKLPITQ